MKHGDLTIIGFFPIYHQLDGGKRQMRLNDGFLPYLAFKYAIDRVNKDKKLFTNGSLGYLAFDTMSNANFSRELFAAVSNGWYLFTEMENPPRMSYIQSFIAGYTADDYHAFHAFSDEDQKYIQVFISIYLLNYFNFKECIDFIHILLINKINK